MIRTPEEANIKDLFEAAYTVDANGRQLAIGAIVYRAKHGPRSERGIVVEIDIPRADVRWSGDDHNGGRTYRSCPLICKLVQL